jgi:drug/metabolite transporter (DMT)-like permease
MLALFLTVLCSTSIALILKHNDTRRGDAIVLLAGNYFVAAGISLIFFVLNENAQFSCPTFLFGSFLGILFVLAFFAFAKAVSLAGTSLSTLSSRLSVIVPLILSVIIYNEYPTVVKVFGFIFTFITIFFFYLSLKGDGNLSLRTTEYFYLLAVLLGIGVNDFCMKIFQHWRPVAEKPFFLLMIFGFAFIYSSGYIVLKRISVNRETVILGGLLGIPNVFSSYFLLSALSVLPGIIVYPVTNIGIIVLTALAALLIWREQLNIHGRWALISGIIAIILLSF